MPADNLANVAFAGNCEPLGELAHQHRRQKFLTDMKATYPSSYVYAFFYDGVNVAAQAVKTAKGSVDPKA